MDKDITKKGAELITKAVAAYLTTIDPEGYPSTRAMFNLKNSKQFPELVEFMSKHNELTLFFTTNTSSDKIKHIMNNPKVSVYYCDTILYQGFMCQGEIEIVRDKEIRHAIWHEDWKIYYPEGEDSEDYSVLRLKPNYIKWYYNLQQSDLKL
jgi:general stress protein 26